MIMTWKKQFIRLAGAMIFILGFTGNYALASDCTSATMITSLPYGINSPGNYCLASNMTFITSWNSSVAAISIAASNVTLDLNGKSITGRWANSTPGAGMETGINVTVGNSGYPEDIVIRNGTVKGLRSGVSNWTNTGSNNVKRLTIENLTITDMVFYGISFLGNSRCDDCTIRNNIITNINPGLCTNCGGSVGAYGIITNKSDNLDIHDNFIYGLTSSGTLPSYGMQLRYSNNALVDHNTVTNLPSTLQHVAIMPFASSNATVQNNTLMHFYRGIWYRYSSGVYSGTTYTDVTIPYTGGTDGGGNQ